MELIRTYFVKININKHSSVEAMTSFHILLLAFLCCDVAKHAMVYMDLNELFGNLVLGFWISMLLHAILGIVYPALSARMKEPEER